MNSEEKLFALMAQAEEIQKAAVELHRLAAKAIEPGITKAVDQAVQAALGRRAEMALESIGAAGATVLAASKEMNKTGANMAFYGAIMTGGVALVLALGLWAWGDHQASYVARLKGEVRELQETAQVLEKKTWGLELQTYDDGSRGIALPKGTTFEGKGTRKDGKTVLILK